MNSIFYSFPSFKGYIKLYNPTSMFSRHQAKRRPIAFESNMAEFPRNRGQQGFLLPVYNIALEETIFIGFFESI
jgi:hypothetical protein